MRLLTCRRWKGQAKQGGHHWSYEIQDPTPRVVESPGREILQGGLHQLGASDRTSFQPLPFPQRDEKRWVATLHSVSHQHLHGSPELETADRGDPQRAE